eukprot:TRINITY_DN50145_c0_g1_i2.p1 TRINITY_DN50145_c0_g1~~TRINITY_DN50145_c0_g1_i2.p1  ORF type:complete len:449 (-),score=106.48 TRINITY_DN50145_c0_g1_i2:109-1455(-)
MVTEEDGAPSEPTRQIRGLWWWVRHPWCRLVFASLIFILDFLYYAEDPIVHAHLDIELPVFGQALTMLISRWPSTPGLVSLKIGLGVVTTLLGCVIGRQVVHHWLLRDKLRINMFEEADGSWTVMLITAVLMLWLVSYPYNTIAGDDEPEVSSNIGLRSFEFGVVAQMCTWLGDLWTWIVVLDSMLQDRVSYPDWCNGWPKGTWAKIRAPACWVLAIAPTAVCFTLLVLNDADGGEDSGWEAASSGSSEHQRCLLVSCVIFVDVVILVQDWEFPSFDSAVDIKLPGFDSTEIDFQACGCCKESRLYKWLDEWGFFRIQISGKWVAYGPLMVILLLDLNAARNQVTYDPVNFGQYPGPEDKIWTIIDSESLDVLYDGLDAIDPSVITFSARMGNATVAAGLSDVEMSSRYEDESYGIKLPGLLPGLSMFPVLFLLICCLLYTSPSPRDS